MCVAAVVHPLEWIFEVAPEIEDENGEESEEFEFEEWAESASSSSTEYDCVCGARLMPDWECVCQVAEHQPQLDLMTLD